MTVSVIFLALAVLGFVIALAIWVHRQKSKQGWKGSYTCDGENENDS